MNGFTNAVSGGGGLKVLEQKTYSSTGSGSYETIPLSEPATFAIVYKWWGGGYINFAVMRSSAFASTFQNGKEYRCQLTEDGESIVVLDSQPGQSFLWELTTYA